MPDQDACITTGEAARLLGLTRQAISAAARAKKIGRKTEGPFGYWVFTRAEIERYKNMPKNKGGRPKGKTGTSVVARPAQ